ncbi:flagellar biosynthesis protein FlhF [Aliidiomarina quisquiliarum]|uniref:flagellar biosynthesis protein FlhF n=1 Tax=Aliidiomarina quisquiliarum TaxID=2938947 RepID=UPI00208F5061|nr:flagellar biosynthesis protein FlhF [Aliidiomarina quisquiliarum]MCO4321676.1 flagellar biosynthesis protein FlhF [Aliidiomarina quisquiliarum]
MKIKRFFAKDMRSALAEVKRTLGPDAVIMSNKTVSGGVELVAAYDPDTAPAQAMSSARRQNTVTPIEELAGGVEKQQAIATSLEALLQRQQEEAAPSQAEALEPVAAAPQPEPQQPVAEPLQPATRQEPSLQEPVAQVAGQMVAESRILNDAQVAARLAAQDSQMETMRDDMAAIRALLEHQVSGLMWQEVERREPMRALLINKLKKLGFTGQVADQISCFIPEGLKKDEAWQQTLDLMQSQIQTTSNDILQKGGVVALVGPTGVGKTTTVAKLAARFARRHGADSVAMITTDTYRIAAAEQLQTYGRIIGCTVKVAKNADELNVVLAQLRQRKLVLIDTAGMSQRDMRLTDQLETLMRNTRLRIRPYLVLAATAQGAVQEEIVRRFKKLPLSGCIFTKLDECLSIGESLSVSIQNSLPISYLTDGQRVPEDIKVADAGDLIARAETMAAASAVVDHQFSTEADFAYV